MKKIILIFIPFLLSTLALSAQSRGLEVVAKALGGEHAVIGKQYAVFIAIDAYKEWMPLKNPVKDAKEIRDILTSRYYIDQVLELYDGDATKSGVLRLFDTLIKTVKPEDSVLIYYAGHGQLDDTETGFWIPVDAGTDQFEQKNWIPNIQVRNNIGKMQARHIVLLSDSCFSGDILNPTRGATPTIDASYFSNAWTRVSRQVLTSGASESVPDQSEFSQQLKLALRGNTQPYLDPLMIYSQIRLGMTRTTPLFGDLKDSGHQDGASFLLFLKNRAEASSAPAAGANAALAAPTANAAPPTADLSVSASMEGAEVFVDGVSYGKAPALASGLPSGRPLKVSARAGAYSASADVTLAPKELKEVSLKLERMKANLVISSSEKDLSVFVDGQAEGPLGTGIFRDLSAGEVSLELKGDGLYYQGKVSLEGNATTKVEAKLWAVGSLEYEAPDGASIDIRNGTNSFRQRVSGSGKLENLAEGSYTVTASDIGYGPVTRILAVTKGQIVTFKLEAPGSLLIKGVPSNVSVVSAANKTAQASESHEAKLSGLPPGASLSIFFSDKHRKKLGRTLAATPLAGQSLELAAPSGRLSFDWLPPNAEVSLDGVDLPVSYTPGARAISDSLLAQEYQLSVSLPDIGTFKDRVTISEGSETRDDKLTSFALDALKAGKKQRRSLDMGAWISLGLGALGAVGAGTSYFLGSQAMSAYEGASVSGDISAERKKVDLLGDLFTAPAIVGGAGLGLSPILFAAGPKGKSVNAMEKDLDAQIESLKGSGP